MGSLHIFLVLVVGAAAVTVGVQLVRATGLRRRLLWLVIGAALVPALAVASSLLLSSREMLGLLDAPGVRGVADAGLALARDLLAREERALVAWADAAAQATRPDTLDVPEATGWQWTGPQGEVALRGGVPVEVDPALLRDPPFERVLRTIDGERVSLVVARRRPDGDLLVQRWIDPDLATDLLRVEQGWQGLHQIGLYYRELSQTRLLVTSAVSLFVVAVLVVAIGRAAGDRLVRPLTDLAASTRRVADGDLGHRVRVRGTGEVGALVEAFNRMTERLAASEESRLRSQRLAAWQGVARRLAHEIKNPLTPIQLAVHRVRKRDADPVVLEALDAIEQEARNLERLATEFSALARLPEPRREDVALRRVLDEVVALYVPERVDVEFRGDPDARLSADRGQLRQVASNLVKNAVQAMGADGRLVFAIDPRDDADPDRVRWSIRDDGPGLPSPADRIFDPGFSVDRSGHGTGSGLGLAIVLRIVEDHGAAIEATNAPDGGAVFTLTWPRAQPEVGARADAPAPSGANEETGA